jgi:hypothetical protein
MDEALLRLIKAAKAAAEALRDESRSWQDEGYQGDYHAAELAELEAAIAGMDPAKIEEQYTASRIRQMEDVIRMEVAIAQRYNWTGKQREGFAEFLDSLIKK